MSVVDPSSGMPTKQCCAHSFISVLVETINPLYLEAIYVFELSDHIKEDFGWFTFLLIYEFLDMAVLHNLRGPLLIWMSICILILRYSSILHFDSHKKLYFNLNSNFQMEQHPIFLFWFESVFYWYLKFFFMPYFDLYLGLYFHLYVIFQM